MNDLVNWNVLERNWDNCVTGNWESQVVTVPSVAPTFIPPRMPLVSDNDILLMAACISNDHPKLEGLSYCFCTLKRLEKGLSKE